MSKISDEKIKDLLKKSPLISVVKYVQKINDSSLKEAHELVRKVADSNNK